MKRKRANFLDGTAKLTSMNRMICPECGQECGMREDGTPKYHDVWVNRMIPRLGVTNCPACKPKTQPGHDQTK